MGPLDDRAVKILVGQRHLVDVVFLDCAAEGILDLLQVGELLLLHVDRREPHRHLLDGQAHLHDVGDLVVVLLEPHLRGHGVFPVGDERALAVSDFDEPHRLQDAQRLPHGRTPDVEQLAQLHFGGELVPLRYAPDRMLSRMWLTAWSVEEILAIGCIGGLLSAGGHALCTYYIGAGP